MQKLLLQWVRTYLYPTAPDDYVTQCGDHFRFGYYAQLPKELVEKWCLEEIEVEEFNFVYVTNFESI